MKVIYLFFIAQIFTSFNWSSDTHPKQLNIDAITTEHFMAVSPFEVSEISIAKEEKIKNGKLVILDMPNKGVAKVNDNNTPNLLEDDFINYAVVGENSGHDEIKYGYLVDNEIVNKPALKINIKL